MTGEAGGWRGKWVAGADMGSPVPPAHEGDSVLPCSSLAVGRLINDNITHHVNLVGGGSY